MLVSNGLVSETDESAHAYSMWTVANWRRVELHIQTKGWTIVINKVNTAIEH